MSELSDWFWSPFLDAAHILWGLVLVGLLTAFIAAGMWSVRVPGEIGRRERKNLANVRRYGTMLFMVLVRCMPLMLVAGATLLFFPMAPPTTLLLSSRARLPHESNDWKERWLRAVAQAALSEGDRCVDLGPVVDQTCTRIMDESAQTGGWRHDDPAARRRLAEIVKETLTKVEPPIADNPARVEHRVETRLPRWVVESVELAILKAQMQSCNARHVVVLAADRPTDFGMAWDQTEEYLKTASPARHTEFLIERVRADESIRIEQVLKYSKESGVVTCLVSVQPSTEKLRVPVRLIFAGKPDLQCRTEIEIERSNKFRMLKLDFTFKDIPAGLKAEAIQQETKPPQRVPIPDPDKGLAFDGNILLRVDRQEVSQVWQATLAKLKNAPAFANWRLRMSELGHDVETVKLSSTVGTVVVDARIAQGSIWVHVNEFPGDRLRQMIKSAEPGEVRPLRGQLADASDFPGVFSWDALPIAQQTPNQVPVAPGTSAAQSVPLGKNVVSAALGIAPRPLVTRFVESVPELDGRTVVVTHLAIDPEQQGMLLTDQGTPGEQYEPSRLVVFWAALLDAVRRAPTPEGSQELNANYPVALLDSSDCNELRAGALTLNLLPLLIGLLVYALFVLRGIANAPAPRKEAT